MQPINQIEQLKLLARQSPDPYTKFSRKEYRFLRQSITIDVAGNILYHHHQRETPLSPKTKPSSVIGKGKLKIIKNLFDENGNPANIVRATFIRIPLVVLKALTLTHLIQDKPHLLPFRLVYERKNFINDTGNICKIIKQPVLYMPKIHTDCEQVITKKMPLDQKQKLQIMYTMALGLSEIHRIGLAHRDIKPANICMDASNNSSLLDFDFVTDSDEKSIGTGTPLYSAPEFYNINAKYTVRQMQKMDIYSLGITYYLFYANVNPERFNNSLYSNALDKVYSEMPSQDSDDESSDDSEESYAQDLSSSDQLTQSKRILHTQSLPEFSVTPSPLPAAQTPTKNLEAVFNQFKIDHQDLLLHHFNGPNADATMKLIGRMVAWNPDDRPSIDEIIANLSKIISSESQHTLSWRLPIKLFYDFSRSVAWWLDANQ